MIVLKNINKTYYSKNQSESQHILRDVNLEINEGEFVSIVGPSGSGKSTLINIIGMLDQNYEGSYLFGGRPVADLTDKKLSEIRNTNLGFIFQNFKLLPEYTVSENIKLPLLYSKNKFKSESDIRSLLKMVNLEEKINDYPKNLSGGQQQRIAIARALVANPTIIIADEPTGALDTVMSGKILDILKSINSLGKTIIMVTHSPEAADIADRKLQIVDGVLTEI